MTTRYERTVNGGISAVLDLLDEMNQNERISYAVYSELHDAVSLIDRTRGA